MSAPALATRLKAHEIDEVRALHRLRPINNLKIPVLYALAIGVGALILAAPEWWMRIPGYLAQACVFAGLGVIMHDGAHGILFKSPLANRLTSQVLATSLGIAFTQFRYAHRFHHRYTMHAEDRDRLFYLRNIPYTIINGGRALYLSTVAGLKTASRHDRMIYFVELGGIICLWAVVLAAVLHYGALWAFVHVFVIPYLLFPSLLIMRLLLEHYDCEADDEYRMTRTFKSNPVCRWLWSNVNYHTVHHFWQGIPWYNLKKAHDLLESHLIANRANISDGYLAAMFDALRRYAFRRPPYWAFPPEDKVRWKKRRPSLAPARADLAEGTT